MAGWLGAESKPCRLPSVPLTASRLDIAAAVAHVSAADPQMAAFIERAGQLEERPREGDAFASLARAIVYQQLAGRAAAAIHRRTVEAIGGLMTAQAVLATPYEQLREAGLSGAKAASLLDLATKSSDGTVPLHELPGLEDDEIIRRLVQVRGIGRWTAEMFLLFELVRPDVWPVDDLGVRHGWSLIHSMAEMIKPRALAAEGDRFRPQRSLVARYCWQAVHIQRAGSAAAGTGAG
jgi:DNA-3-methyladenine glycosylase II